MALMTHSTPPSPLLMAIFAALNGCSSGVIPNYQGEGCMVVSEDTEQCPAANAVSPDELFVPWTCDVDVLSIEGEGTRTTVSYQTGDTEPACCYPITGIDNMPNCVIGRPYFEAGRALMAPVRHTDADAAASAASQQGDQAQAWALAGSGEHASVAAFARLALQLMACGAPTDLLRATHEAAIDEVRHAEACWDMARRLGATEVVAGEFPFNAPIDASIRLDELAAGTAVEGCLAETLGAHLAAVAAERATDPEIKRVLTAIAAEEANHAVLSFRIVAWALQAGGAEVRAGVQAALSQPWPRVDIDELALRAGVARAELARAADEGVARVLRPAVQRLMMAA